MCRAREAGVIGVLVPAVGPDSWEETLRCTTPRSGWPTVWCALGVHPYALAAIDPRDDLDVLDGLAQRARDPTATLIAVGECGLDFRPRHDRARQRRVLQAQLELSRELGLPCVLHCVRAYGSLLEMLERSSAPPSMIHSFGGSLEIASQLVRRGDYLSFSSAVCDPRRRRVREAAATISIDRLLIETDTPDQPPPGRRSTINEPAFVVDVARAIARLRDTSTEEIADRSRENFRRLMGVAP